MVFFFRFRLFSSYLLVIFGCISCRCLIILDKYLKFRNMVCFNVLDLFWGVKICFWVDGNWVYLGV